MSEFAVSEGVAAQLEAYYEECLHAMCSTGPSDRDLVSAAIYRFYR